MVPTRIPSITNVGDAVAEPCLSVTIPIFATSFFVASVYALTSAVPGSAVKEGFTKTEIASTSTANGC
mgnify:CR=1 FL=1